MGIGKCVIYEGRHFCWDQKTKRMLEMFFKPVDIKDCPEEVIKGIMTLLDEKGTQ